MENKKKEGLRDGGNEVWADEDGKADDFGYMCGFISRATMGGTARRFRGEAGIR